MTYTPSRKREIEANVTAALYALMIRDLLKQLRKTRRAA